jgi:hypothetical protein
MKYDTSVVDTLYSRRGNTEFLKALAFTFLRRWFAAFLQQHCCFNIQGNKYERHFA